MAGKARCVYIIAYIPASFISLHCGPSHPMGNFPLQAETMRVWDQKKLSRFSVWMQLILQEPRWSHIW